MKDKTKVVTIGGGNGSATVLEALKQHRDVFDISAAVSVSDSGGSSGCLRQEFNALPPGDILRAVLALSVYDYKILKNIFYRERFSGAGKLDNHNLGNLFLTLAGKYAGDFVSATRALEQAVDAVGHVYPAALEQTDLAVELSNGEIVKGEAEIDVPKYDRSLRIQKAWLEPAGQVYSGAKEAIEQADAIIFCPGSLYTSVIAALLSVGVKEAIAASKAKLIYVPGSVYELEGETGPEKLSDFVKELQSYLPRKIDLVIHNVHALNTAEQKKYQDKKWAVFENDKEKIPEYKVMDVEYEKPVGVFWIERLGEILRETIGDKNK
ncbi:MAG: YvcK family protein [Candidatus Magasanikbacteria bacterium]|nr:YvcK family protein [Candidatus Magasanikbacteria bacterium]